MTARPRIGILVGSNRPVNVGRPVADELVQLVEQAGGEPVLLDLAEIRLPFLDEAMPPGSGIRTQPHTIAWGEQVAGVDAMVFLTPQYNHGYPAALKNALDSIFAEWKDKPGLVVGYGWGGAQEAIAQLEQVLTFLGIRFAAPPVQLRFGPDTFDEQMRIVDAAAFVAGYRDDLSTALGDLVRVAATAHAEA